MLYYNYALARGADQPTVLKHLGIAELELHNNRLAEAAFRRAIQLKPRSKHPYTGNAGSPSCSNTRASSGTPQ